MTWLGNLAGAVALGAIFWLGGGGQMLKEGADLAFNVRVGQDECACRSSC